MFTLFPQRIPAEIDRQSDYRLTSWEDVDPVSFLVRTVFLMLTDCPEMISALTAAKVNWLDIFLEIMSAVNWSQFLLCRGNLMDLLGWWSLSPNLLNSPALV